MRGVTADLGTDKTLCEIQWIDRPPSRQNLDDLMEKAAAAYHNLCAWPLPLNDPDDD